VLVEANCRLHGGDGQWEPVARRCLGYSQISALADAYLDPAAFARLPSLPVNMKAFGASIDMRSTVSGTFSHFNEESLRRIRELPSYISEALDIKVHGCRITSAASGQVLLTLSHLLFHSPAKRFALQWMPSPLRVEFRLPTLIAPRC